MARKILVTAFGAFPGVPSNPTLRIVQRLALNHRARLARLGIELVIETLPVHYAAVPQCLARMVETHAPDAILHLGVAGRRRVISVETRALNRVSTLRVDAARALHSDGIVLPQASFVQRARWPASRLCATMNASGATTRPSIDAGDYVCNQTLYLSLARTTVPAGFIHVPHPRARKPLRDCGATQKPTLTQMVDAIASAIILICRQSRAQA